MMEYLPDPDLVDRPPWAPPASQDRAASPSGLSRYASSQSGIDWRGALPEILAALACIAIWAGAFYAIGEL